MAHITIPSAPAPRLTDAAVARACDLIAQDGNEQLKLRVYINGGGCSGFLYGFALDDDINDDDTRVERDGLTLLVDAMSMQYLSGAEIGYEDKLGGARFVIKNPNATTTCGCGSSFAT
jgi:iron-sulfur cluster insertion protein